MPPRRPDGLFARLVHLPWPVALVAGLIGFVAIRWGLTALLAAVGPRFPDAMAWGAKAPTLLAAAFALACLMAAAMSFLQRGPRLEAEAAQAKVESIRSLTWNQIEQVVGEAYRRRGFQVDTAPAGEGGGLDLLLTKDGEATLVHCGQWRTQHVGVSVVREFEKRMGQHRVAAGKILCAGVFSTDCFRFAVGKPIELVDGETLQKMVAAVRADTTLVAPV